MKRAVLLLCLIVTLVYCTADEGNRDMPSTDMSLPLPNNIQAPSSHKEVQEPLAPPSVNVQSSLPLDNPQIPPPNDIIASSSSSLSPLPSILASPNNAQNSPTNNNQSTLPNSIQSMWATVRQSLGNLVRPASIDTINRTPISNSTNISINKENSTVSIDSSKEEEITHNEPNTIKINQVSSEQNEANDDDDDDKKDLPIQMAPIEKGLVYLRPKANERWILNQEGMITWGISSYIQARADEIFMNCNLYLRDKMIMSVFKGVPLIIGTESWTPPTFLEPSPEYRLRLWSQPSSIGIIDQYSEFFSIVPRKEDVFMFSYNKSVVFDNSNNKTMLIPTDKAKIGQNEPPAPSISEKHGVVIDVNSTPSSLDPNVPTGIYALYPSVATSKHKNNVSKLATGAFSSLILISFLCELVI